MRTPKTLIMLNVGNPIEYVDATLESLTYTDNLDADIMCIIASRINKPSEICDLLHKHNIKVKKTIVITTPYWGDSIKAAFGYFNEMPYEWLATIDSDNVLNPDWLDNTKRIYKEASKTKPMHMANAHLLLYKIWGDEHDDFLIRPCGVGTLMLFNKKVFPYEDLMKLSSHRLERDMYYYFYGRNIPAVCPLKSYVQHLRPYTEGVSGKGKLTRWRRDKGGAGFVPHNKIKHIWERVNK